MIDIWLIFNLTIPFLEVLLHTYMDYYRDDTDKEKTIEIGDNKAKITRVLPEKRIPDEGSKYEDIQVSFEQQKNQERLMQNKVKNLKKVKRAEFFLSICIPILILCFVAFYWLVGLQAAYGE